MDLFGISPLELVAVLLVATMVLGPAKMVDMARNLGKLWREAQRMLRETADAATAGLDAPLDPTETRGQAGGLPAPEGSVGSRMGPTPEEDQPPSQTSPASLEETTRHG